MSELQPRILGLIPARGGSKRLPRKNLLPLAGRPLIAWTIAAALAARGIDRVVVSTDDAEIADTARAHGAEVPFMRPAALADDHASGLQVMLHALNELQAAGEQFDFVALLQPTSPLRRTDDIEGAIARLRETRGDMVVSVCASDHPPEWANTLPPDGALRDFFRPGIRGVRSQDLPVQYRLNGAIYLYNCRRLLETGSDIMDDNAYAYIMPRERSIDIDTALDLHIAEAILTHGGEARP